MKFKAILFIVIMLFSSVFTFGDAFILNVKNDLLGVRSNEHHHVDRDSHEKDHSNENHSEDCKDECHFCLFSSVTNTYFLEIPELIFQFGIEEFSQPKFFYLLLSNESYLDGIWQPPRFIG